MPSSAVHTSVRSAVCMSIGAHGSELSARFSTLPPDPSRSLRPKYTSDLQARQTLPKYLRARTLPVRGRTALHEHFLSASVGELSAYRTPTLPRNIATSPALDKCASASDLFVTRPRLHLAPVRPEGRWLQRAETGRRWALALQPRSRRWAGVAHRAVAHYN